ncbi:hybrid sensor histidine kinase/response regulator [Qingshengfaniella alkalisoli]|uniref:histidine kinase n=1 Tax=Qingshengfaniella alkalisoli TaxID=2599296 RepID=A0A5B8IXV5_9RHOB|nr:response regulator [Qingshengfaniella alkalisoli]QDY70574.1 response regulator [Qingshengfaniella alkalisoli]
MAAGSQEEIRDTTVTGVAQMRASTRPVLQAIAKLIATDRRPSVLATTSGEVLLANSSANRIGFGQDSLVEKLDWVSVRDRAKRAGVAQVSTVVGSLKLEGELVQLSLGPVDGFLLRLSESESEVSWLRNRARSATLLRVAHDLRTPIQSLVAVAESALGENQKDVQRADVQRTKLRRAADLALDHISNVLSVIRGEQGVSGLLPDEDFSIVEELRSLLAMVEPIAESRGTKLVLTLEAPEYLRLHGPLRFVRALYQNMLDNAVKYGGSHVDVTLRCEPLPADAFEEELTDERWNVYLEVADRGGGLPKEQRARLEQLAGQPRQVAPADSQAPDGTRPSAGLNVLAHALRQLGGELEILDRDGVMGSQPGDTTDRERGTVLRVQFSLPAASAAGIEAEPQAILSETQPLKNRYVLLVEDSPASREWLSRILVTAGAQVKAAASGPEALKLLDDSWQDIEVVLTDVTLPQMSGIDLARRIRDGEPPLRGPWRGSVVGLTAHVDDRIRSACREAGMLRVLEKPIRPAQLCKALSEVLTTPETVPAKGKANGKGRVAGDPTAPIDQETVSDLIDQFGTEGAIGFMERARREALSVLEEIERDGVGPDTGRQLHAATGASGLTGLALIECRLRAVELVVEGGGHDLAPLLEALKTALSQTAEAIDALR